MVLHGSRSLDSEDVVRGDSTVREGCSCTDEVAFLYEDLLGQRDEVRLLLTEFGGDEEFAVTTLDLTIRYLTVDLRNDSGVRGVTRLKELRDTGETGGDITAGVLRTSHREECVTDLDGIAILDLEVRFHREVVGTEDITILIKDMRLREFGLILGLGDIDLAFAGLLIGLGLTGDSLDDVLEADMSVLLDEERDLIGIPLADTRTLLILLTRGDEEFGRIRYIEGSEYDTCLLVLEGEGVLT